MKYTAEFIGLVSFAAIFGGVLIVGICLRRTLNLKSSLKVQAAGMDSP